ncbi:hypothetical protein D3C78_1452570 [compost metagenome]
MVRPAQRLAGTDQFDGAGGLAFQQFAIWIDQVDFVGAIAQRAPHLLHHFRRRRIAGGEVAHAGHLDAAPAEPFQGAPGDMGETRVDADRRHIAEWRQGVAAEPDDVRHVVIVVERGEVEQGKDAALDCVFGIGHGYSSLFPFPSP